MSEEKTRRRGAWQAIGTACISLALVSGTGQEARAQALPQVVAQAQTLDGQPATLTLAPGQLVLLKLWASWCGPCRADLLHAQQLAATTQGRVVVVALNVDNDLATAREAARRWGIEGVVLWDRDHAALGALRPAGLPAAFLFDGRGALRWRRVGADAAAHGALRDALTALLKERQS